MNFVLIHFLARTGLEIALVLVHLVVLHAQQRQPPRHSADRHLDTATSFSFPFSNIFNKAMEKSDDTPAMETRGGAKQRRSYFSAAAEQEHTQKLAVDEQSVEMCREGSSGQSSLKSQSSLTSLGTESSCSKEATDVIVHPGQPINFGTVVPGVYRSSYPQEADYPFIQKLGLKTIM